MLDTTGFQVGVPRESSTWGLHAERRLDLFSAMIRRALTRLVLLHARQGFGDIHQVIANSAIGGHGAVVGHHRTGFDLFFR